MSLKRDRSGNYVCRFWTNGRGSRLVYENFGPISHKDASKREAALVAKWKARPASVDPRLTFGKLADLYVESKGARLSKRGRALAEMQLRCHLKPFFGEMRVEDIKAADVERYREQRRQLVRRKGIAGRVSERTDLPVAPSTFNREWSFIRAILNFAERTERVDRNPIRRGAVEMLPTTPRSVFFEPAEWAAFIEAASADDELRRTVPALRLLLLTGSRIGEVAGLKWADVDLERKLLRVAQEKTRSSKTLPIAPAVAEILGSLVRGVPAAPLFIRAGGAPMTTAYLQVAFARIRRRAGLDAGQHGKPTPHSVRHTAATWLRRASVPIDRIAAVLGHHASAESRITLGYTHLEPAELEPAMRALEAAEAAAFAIRERTVNENRPATGEAKP